MHESAWIWTTKNTKRVARRAGARAKLYSRPVPRTRLLALTLALCLIPGSVMAKKAPDYSRERIDETARTGEEQGNPRDFLLAAQMAFEQARNTRDLELAELAVTHGRVALDIGLYLSDERNYEATDWHPVPIEDAAAVATEARLLIAEAERLAETIIAERAAAEEEERRRAAELAAAEQDDPKRERKPGTGLIAGGAVALTIGAGGLGMIGAGVALGQAHQRDAEALLLPDQLAELDELDRKGAQANAITYAGIGVATVGLAVGVALIVVGVKKRKAAGPPDETALRVGGWLDRDAAGVTVGGRF